MSKLWNRRSRATQIKGMGDLHAYFVQRGFQNKTVIVPVRIPYTPLPEVQAPHLPRVIPARNVSLPPDVEALPSEPLTMPAPENDSRSAASPSHSLMLLSIG